VAPRACALRASGSALDLAVFRVTVAVVIAASSSAMVAPDWAALPSATRVAPLGVGFLLPHLPITPELVTGVRAVMYAACVTGALGLFSRASFALVTVTAAYVLLIPQLGGAVFHDHHLLWFAALLAASPCGDALSVDAWRARRQGAPPPDRGPAHGLALRFAWLFVGLIYFFPAVHKLRAMGLDWALSDNLRHQLWWKWAHGPHAAPAPPHRPRAVAAARARRAHAALRAQLRGAGLRAPHALAGGRGGARLPRGHAPAHGHRLLGALRLLHPVLAVVCVARRACATGPADRRFALRCHRDSPRWLP
jgi:hypothetical protein